MIIHVVNSMEVALQLQLSLELALLEKPMGIALNMDDEAKQKGVMIDEHHLEKHLGMPCIKTSSKTKDNLEDLMFTIGFMSCGAKLPIYVLFIAAFFQTEDAGNVLFLLYILSAVLGLLLARVLSMFVFYRNNEPFVMTMPDYRMPHVSLLLRLVWAKAVLYLKKAGTFILAASVLIWLASHYPKAENVSKQTQFEQSFLRSFGKATQHLFEPIGFDWKMTVALETGLAAKEVVVATLSVLYHEESERHLSEILSEKLSFAQAMSFLTFVMIYLPCLAACRVFLQDIGSVRYLFYLVVITIFMAYTLSWLAYTLLA